MKRQTYLGIILLVIVVLVAGCGGGTEQLKPANASDIVHFYGFEGSADDTIGGLNGTINGSAAFSDFCYVGSKALDLSTNGATKATGGSYVQLPPSLTLPEDMTVTAWVYVSEYNAWSRIFDFQNASTNQGIYLTLNDGSYLTFNVNNGLDKEKKLRSFWGNKPNASTFIPLKEWIHVAFTWSADEGPAVFINGKNINAWYEANWIGIAPCNLGELTNNYIGRSNWDNPDFKGYIDDFRIYKTVLSANDIAKLADQ
ncbi:MAG TPA: LamG domain-containing protein [Bacillota bacterium]|nr:LamG domain-containing protein [Bacillota bacterium]